jgi:hypothetical protein
MTRRKVPEMPTPPGEVRRTVALLGGPPGVLKMSVNGVYELYLLTCDDDGYWLQPLKLSLHVTATTCTCPEFSRTGGCRHRDAIKALQDAERL